MSEYNAANEEHVLTKKEKVEKERRLELEDIFTMLQTPSGVRFFKRFLNEGRIFHSNFTGNSRTFFLEGRRAFALQFFADICEASPESVAGLMLSKKEETSI